MSRLRRLALRDVWPHEALDFTRWLEVNIEVLGEVVGLDLAATERESAAGAFSVDLLAEDNDGRLVVIENQLGRSDHDHLGKLITYISVLEAQSAIWIVADPRPEHVTAVSWLNASASADVFLVKAEAVAIGDSDPAPLLTLIVGPSAEVREASGTKKELADRHHVRKRFWTDLLATARERTRLHSAVSPGTDNWVGTGAGVSGLAYNYVVTQHAARVELYIDRGEESLNDRTFEHFLTRREEIEDAFGESLDWQHLPERRACRINAPVADHGYKDEEHWPAIQASMLDAMIRLEAALAPTVAAIRS